MRGLLTKAWRDIVQRPARSLLTILGIAAGIAALVAITSTARTIERAQRDVYTDTSQANITYWVWDAPASLVPLLESDDRIAAAELRLSYVTRWRHRDVWKDMELVGLDGFDTRVNRFELVSGAWPSAGELLIEESAAKLEGIILGDEVIIRDSQGRTRPMTVSGLSRSPSYLSSTITRVTIAYAPATTVRRFLDISGSNQLLVRLEDTESAPLVAEKISQLLRIQKIQSGAPNLRNPNAYPGKRELDALIAIMFLFSGLGLAVSVFLVINTLSATVAEQIAEIGMLKSLGATRGNIMLVYLIEAGIYSTTGTLLGIVMGAMGGWQLVRWIARLGNATVQFSVAGEGVLLGIVTGIGVGLVGGAIPARQGARISIREALEGYGIHTDYGRSLVDGVLKRITHLPPLMAMALRNLFRRKLRGALTLSVVALSTAAFVAATATRDSVNAAIDEIYRTYATDAWMWISSSATTQLERLLEAVDGVETAEGWTIANGIVGLAEARLWGIPDDSTLYRQVMRAGRWYEPGERDVIVLSAELADNQRLRVGDRVEIQSGRHMRQMQIIGIAIDNTIFLGGTLSGKAFLPRASLGDLMQTQDQVSLFALGLQDRSQPVADEILARVESKFQRYRPTIQPAYVEVASAQEASRLLTLALTGMVIIVAIVGSLGILNTLTLNVLERRREIAVMRAVGGTDLPIVVAFLTEGLTLGIIGWAAGLVIGYPAAVLFVQQMSRVLFALDLRITPLAMIGSLAITMILAFVSSAGPSLGAARTSVSEALRYE